MRVWVVALIAVLALVGCTSTSTTGTSKSDAADAGMYTACTWFAQVFVGAQPNNDLPAISKQQGIDTMVKAATIAHTAAELNPDLTDKADRIGALAAAMKAQDSAGMAATLQPVIDTCNPYLGVTTSTT